MGDNNWSGHICGPQRLTAEVIGLYESEYKMEMRCASAGARHNQEIRGSLGLTVDNNRCRSAFRKTGVS